MLFNDGPIFIALAEAARQGDWATVLGHPFHPLYPLCMAAVRPLVGDMETAGVVVSVAAGTAAVGAMYAFARRFSGPGPALVAAALLAVHPVAIEYSGDVQSEGLYLALFLGAVAALWPALRGARSGPAFVGGLLVGLAYLARPEGLGLAGLVAGLGLVRAALGAAPRRATLRWVAVLVCGVLLTGGPYLAWLRAHEGTWSLTQKKSVEVMAGLAEEPVRGPDPFAPAPAVSPAGKAAPKGTAADPAPPSAAPERPHRDEPSPWARTWDAVGDLIHTHFRALRYAMLPFLLAGWWPRERRRPGLRAAFVGTVLGGYAFLLALLVLNVGYVSGRHAMPATTLLFAHAAEGLLILAAALAPRLRGRGALAVGLLLALFAGLGLGKALRPDRLDGLADRRAAEWLRAQGAPVQGVAARKRRTAYYAGAPFVAVPSAAYPGGLRELGASHLILTENERREYGKLGPLEPPEARLVHRVSEAGETASVWELLPSGPDRPTRERAP